MHRPARPTWASWPSQSRSVNYIVYCSTLSRQHDMFVLSTGDKLAELGWRRLDGAEGRVYTPTSVYM
jgi:hypothetical protein